MPLATANTVTHALNQAKVNLIPYKLYFNRIQNLDFDGNFQSAVL